MISIVIPVHNQLHYTSNCLDTLAQTIPASVNIVVVDNGSSDGTAEFLAKTRRVHVLRNPVNKGCAASWNQGVKMFLAEWTLILNNDTLLPKGWFDGLLTFAKNEKVEIASPAIREGELNYDFEPYAAEFMTRMAGVARRGDAHGICFLVHTDVFETIGFFDENFRVGVFEDTDFFRRAAEGGFKLATTGQSFLHHYGSVTQNAIRQQKNTRPYEAENRAYFNAKWRRSRPERSWMRLRTRTRLAWTAWTEQRENGHSLIEKFVDGKVRYH